MSPRTQRPHAMPLHRLILVMLMTAALSLATAGPAMAYEPVGIVHTERVQAGPYEVTVGFSTWPVRAMQSLDFSFIPDGGIDGKSGSLLMDGPGVAADERTTPLVRHPRKLDVWGLDVKAFASPGDYSFAFAIDGPLGRGEGSSPLVVAVLDQPGPPIALSWAICSLPFLGLIAFLTVAWRRTRPGRQSLVI